MFKKLFIYVLKLHYFYLLTHKLYYCITKKCWI